MAISFKIQENGNDVTLKTKVVTATISGTVVDEEPTAIYTIDKVLLPRELFKGTVEAEEPAPAPKAAKKKKKAAKKGETAEDDAEAQGPDSSDDYSDDDTADQTAKNSGGRLGASVAMAFCFLVVGFRLI